MNDDPLFVPGRHALPPPSPKGKAPEDPAKRREFFEDWDEFGGEKTIEEYIYQMDSYRSTTSVIKYPHPLYAQDVPEAFQQKLQNKETLYAELYAILESREVHRVRSLRFETLSKPGYSEGSEIGMVTLLVSVESDGKGGRRQWSAAKRDCANILEAHGFDNVEVEIVDDQRAFAPSLYPIPPSDLHILCYESFRHALLEFICEKLRDSWVSICLWRVGNLFKSSTYEIVIMVRPFAVADWQSLAEEISNEFISKATKGSNDIGVLFMPGGSGKVADEGGLSFADNLPEHPHLGSSIGVDGELGTFGGYITLRTAQDPTLKRYMLTNAHVVRPAQSTPRSARRTYDIHGVGPADTHPSDLRRASVRYPAVKDLGCTRKDLQSRIDELRGHNGQIGWIGSLQRSIARDEGDGSTGRAESLRRALNAKSAELNRWLQLIQRCGTMPNLIGQTFFSTGRGLNAQGRVLDFALVEMNDTSMRRYAETTGNVHIVDDQGQPGPISLQDGKIMTDTKKLFLRNMNQPVTGFGRIEKGHWYLKSGRTTGRTSGICNGTEAYVNLPGYRTPYDSDGEPEEFQHVRYSTELVIATPEQRQLQHLDLVHDRTWTWTIQQSFVELGDSGALVVNAQNQACGLVFGHLTGAVGPFEWKPIGPPCWKPAKDISEGTEKDNLGNQPYGSIIGDQMVYGASCGLVMEMEDIREHLRLRMDAEIDI